MKTKFFATAAAIALFATAPVYAETVTTATTIAPQDVPGVTEVDFSTFDTNHDGVYSMEEVGDRLFESFDKDGNGSIDNNEWDEKTVMTIAPMKMETFQYVDKDDDGMAEESTYTYQTFYEASGLIKFDHNQNGLSAEEFIGVGFQKLDDDDNNLINKEEWREAYIAMVKPESAEQERYN